MQLNASYPTEMYVSDAGYLVIKQDCFECGRETQFLFSPDQTKTFVNLLPDFLNEQTERWTGIIEQEN